MAVGTTFHRVYALLCLDRLLARSCVWPGDWPKGSPPGAEMGGVAVYLRK